MITTFAYDRANRLKTADAGGAVTSYVHDAAGNRTEVRSETDLTAYGWNAAGLMGSAEPVEGPVGFTYNADGQRVAKTSTDSSVTGYLYDGSNLLHETDDVGGEIGRTFATTTDEEYGDLVGEDGAGNERYYQFDAQGNVNAVLDASGEVLARFKYHAFGDVASAQDEAWATLSVDQWAELSVTGWAALPANPASEFGAMANLGLAGRKQYYLDPETHLYLLGSGNSDGGGRYYDPATARFTSEDPIRRDAGDENLYRYVGNDPVNELDPSGYQATAIYVPFAGIGTGFGPIPTETRKLFGSPSPQQRRSDDVWSEAKAAVAQKYQLTFDLDLNWNEIVVGSSSFFDGRPLNVSVRELVVEEYHKTVARYEVNGVKVNENDDSTHERAVDAYIAEKRAAATTQASPAARGGPSISASTPLQSLQQAEYDRIAKQHMGIDFDARDAEWRRANRIATPKDLEFFRMVEHASAQLLARKQAANMGWVEWIGYVFGPQRHPGVVNANDLLVAAAPFAMMMKAAGRTSASEAAAEKRLNELEQSDPNVRGQLTIPNTRIPPPRELAPPASKSGPPTPGALDTGVGVRGVEIGVSVARNAGTAGNVGKSELGNALSGLGRNPLGRNINTLDEFGSGAGFSGVFDVESGKWLAYPSGETLLLDGNMPLNRVLQYQGHRQVNAALSELLGNTSRNRLGFSMVLDEAGNFRMGWNSLTINEANPDIRHRAVPENMRQQVLDAIMQSSGRKAYTP